MPPTSIRRCVFGGHARWSRRRRQRPLRRRQRRRQRRRLPPPWRCETSPGTCRCRCCLPLSHHSSQPTLFSALPVKEQTRETNQYRNQQSGPGSRGGSTTTTTTNGFWPLSVFNAFQLRWWGRLLMLQTGTEAGANCAADKKSLAILHSDARFCSDPRIRIVESQAAHLTAVSPTIESYDARPTQVDSLLD